MTAALTLQGCALQPSYVAPDTNVEGTRLLLAESRGADQLSIAPAWWLALGDPAVDLMVAYALRDNPTLGRAIAMLDQARAEARTGRAGHLPMLDITGSNTRERTQPLSKPAGNGQTAGKAELALVWEADLFGRVRNTAAASKYRLDSRNAEAEAIRLSVIAEVADTVISLRACRYSDKVLSADIASRETDLALIRQRRNAGFAADVDVALSETGLEAARTALYLRRQECAGLVSTLVLLSGLPGQVVVDALAASPEQLPVPRLPETLPADVLINSPGVVAAERNVAAAWADIAVARAERMPRLDLKAALSGQWISALGSVTDSSQGGIGLGLTLPVFDGGRGAAAVSASQARYRGAVADLDAALRQAARDTENAMSANLSARSRQVSAQRALSAASQTLTARTAQWQAGTISQLEVEDARRQYAAAQDSLIAASRDAAQSWIALVRATGMNPPITPHISESRSK
ncbi:MAG: efflux transporter outer membrane subunit [Asticcacaulis sp.]